jgi:hypothetical protein
MTNQSIQNRYKTLRVPGSAGRFLREAASFGVAAALELHHDAIHARRGDTPPAENASVAESSSCGVCSSDRPL